MLPLRLLRSGLLLAGLLATFGLNLRAADGGFTATLSAEEKTATGLDGLSVDETVALDQLVSDDLSRARQLKANLLPGTLASRHSEAAVQAAGLDRLTPEQLAKLDDLVAEVIAARPLPKDRPRLRGSEVLSEQGRLRVHGGMSFTVGGGSGSSFYGSSAWVSYYDTVTGLGLSFAVSQFSGDGLYGYHPGYGYSGRAYSYAPISYYSASPRTTFTGMGRSLSSGGTRSFKGDGASLRGPAMVASNRGGRR